MASTLRSFLLSVLLLGLFISCNKPEVIIDLEGDSYELLNTDSATVQFPDNFSDNITVISFIYTHCPDVCPVITANMKNIQNQLQDTSGVQFVEITFDPERDTPSVLRNYKKNYRLNNQFSVLTGKPAIIDSLMNRLQIVAQKTRIDSVHQNEDEYFIRHSNTIYVMDKYGRIRADFMASRVPPEHVVEIIQKLR
jgi:protein SCO1/2